MKKHFINNAKEPYGESNAEIFNYMMKKNNQNQ